MCVCSVGCGVLVCMCVLILAPIMVALRDVRLPIDLTGGVGTATTSRHKMPATAC